MVRSLAFALILSPAASAEVSGLPFVPPPCARHLSPDDFSGRSTAELALTIRFGLDHHILAAPDLSRHYRAGTRGSKLKKFISYITKQLIDDTSVRAVGRATSPTEAWYQAELARLRREALAYGEHHPDAHAALTTAWRLTVRELATTRD